MKVRLAFAGAAAALCVALTPTSTVAAPPSGTLFCEGPKGDITEIPFGRDADISVATTAGDAAQECIKSGGHPVGVVLDPRKVGDR